MKLFFNYIFFLFLMTINNAYSQNYKYLTPPPADIGKNQEVGKMMGFADWIITIVVIGFFLVCAVTAGSHLKDNKYKEAAGPVLGIFVVLVVISVMVLK